MLRVSFLVTVVFVFAFVHETRAACYYRNGTKTTSDYSPCSSDASNPLSTVCCASWDTCLPNGLCQAFNKGIWRESCTKQNWDDGGCQEMCSNEREAQRNDNIRATPCDGTGNTSSTTWCCGGSDACCTDGSELPVYTLAKHFGDPIPTSAPAPSRSSPPSASTTNAAPSASSTAPTVANDGLSTGAEAGIGVGAALGAVVLVVLGVFVYKALQWRKRTQVAAPPYSYPEHLACASAEVNPYQQEPKLVQLAGVENTVHEMPGFRDTSEMRVTSPDAIHEPAASRF